MPALPDAASFSTKPGKTLARPNQMEIAMTNTAATITDLKDKLATTADKAKDTAASAADVVKDTATTAADKAKDAAASAADTARGFSAEVKAQAAGKLEAVRDAASEKAGAVRDTLVDAADRLADRLVTEGDAASGLSSQVMNGLAGGISTVSNSVRGRSLGDVVADVQGFARRNPATFALGAAVAGFALARFIGSSSQRQADAARTAAETTDRFYRDAARRAADVGQSVTKAIRG